MPTMPTRTITITGYIYLNDIEGWHADHPEALRRLRKQAPPGAYWTTAGNDGGWWEAVIPPSDTGDTDDAPADR